MNFQSFFKRFAAAVFAAACVFTVSAVAQQVRPRPTPGPSQVLNKAAVPSSVAGQNNLYCAGYVQTSPVETATKLVGGYNEQEQFLYSENNFVYINAGSDKGVRVGDMMSVFRPRGAVKTRWSRKGDLGFYVQELGVVEVVRVKPDVSVARVKTSCADMLLGDLVQPFQKRTAPVYGKRPPLDTFGDPSGKATGRLFMSRDNKELLSAQQIVYVDLGADSNLQPGDYLTIFRPLGNGNIVTSELDDAGSTSYGFQSNKYRGGEFSNQAPRVTGERAQGGVATIERTKRDRPQGLRKVVGEAVILNVKERTATAVITRNSQEIHTGDWVEVQ